MFLFLFHATHSFKLILPVAAHRTLCKEFYEQECKDGVPIDEMRYKMVPCVFFYPTVPMFHLEKYSLKENEKTQESFIRSVFY